MTNYKTILRNALRISLNRPKLWLLSIFAGIFISKNILRIINDIFVFISEQGQNWIIFKQLLNSRDAVWEQINQAIQINLGGYVSDILTATILLSIVFIILAIATWAQIVVIQSLAKNKKNETQSPKSFFWRVAGVNVFIFCIQFVFLKLFSIPIIIYTIQSIPSTVAYLFALTCAVLISIAYFFFTILSLLATYRIITENSQIMVSIKTEFQNLKTQWLIFFEFTVLLFLIELFFAMLSAAMLTLTIDPLVSLLATVSLLPGAPLYAAAIYLCIAIIIIAVFIGYGILNTFQFAFWWGLIDSLKKKTITSKIINLFREQ